MSKIIVRRQVYANNGTHANEIEAVVQENLIANTLSSATDIAPSVGLLKSTTDTLSNNALKYCNTNIPVSSTKTFNIPSGSRHLFAMTTLNTQAVAIYSIGATGAGSVAYVEMFVPSTPLFSISKPSGSTNKLTITNNATISLDVIFIVTSGNMVTVDA